MDTRGIADGDTVRVSSPRGSIELRAIVMGQVAQGTVFIPFHFKEAPANALTSEKLDPFGKIPDYKFCAVRVELVASAAPVGAGEEAG
jgi:formate dehydrogenase major subunit